MKISTFATIVSSALMAAGCASRSGQGGLVSYNSAPIYSGYTTYYVPAGQASYPAPAYTWGAAPIYSEWVSEPIRRYSVVMGGRGPLGSYSTVQVYQQQPRSQVQPAPTPTGRIQSEEPASPAPAPATAPPAIELKGSETNQAEPPNQGAVTPAAPATEDTNKEKEGAATVDTNAAPSAAATVETNAAAPAVGGTAESALGGTASGASHNLTVQGTTDEDRKLAGQLQEQLKADPSLASATSGLKISFDNGAATLHGSVKTESDKDAVEKAVQKISGVTSVHNELEVNPAKTDSNENK